MFAVTPLLRFAALSLVAVAATAAPDSAVRWQSWPELAAANTDDDGRLRLVHLARRGDALSAQMRRESFANPAIAESLASNFRCVAVDPDEYPGVAAALGAFVADQHQERGLPLNVWFTPGGLPITGRTYLVPTDEWGKPGLISLLERLARRQREDAGGLAAEAAGRLRRLTAKSPAPPLDLAALNREAVAMLGAPNAFSRSGPAFSPVQPMVWRYLVQQANAGRTEAAFVFDLLAATARGPLRDAERGTFRLHAPPPDSPIRDEEPDPLLQIGALEAYLDAARSRPDPVFRAASKDLSAWLTQWARATDDAPLETVALAALALGRGAEELGQPPHAAGRLVKDLIARVRQEGVAGLSRLPSRQIAATPRDYAAAALSLRRWGESRHDETASALAGQLLRQLEERFVQGGLATFARGTALPTAPFADVWEDGCRPTATSLRVALLGPEAAQAAAATLLAAPDLHPAVLFELNRPR